MLPTLFTALNSPALLFSESWKHSYHRKFILYGGHLQIYQKVTLLCEAHQELAALVSWGKLALSPVLLTCTEHVVSDFNFGGCLADILVYNGQIELLQNCGEVVWASGPCFFQVSPTSYPPFVTCQHQPVEGSIEYYQMYCNSFLLPGSLAANSLNKASFLKAQRRLL